MATRARGESAPVDDEFLHNLYKGGELLAAGKVIEAKDYLERAFKLQPKNEKGQNLLGLTYFKLGLFDRAAEIYETLVRDNPVDATLRVNLGLVYLKTNQLQRAIREFETSVDLAPEHKKAHNYLGLALAQVGSYAEAREHFIEAGSEAMAQKMERALAGEATGLHRMPAPLEQQHQEKFAEIEGSEIVSERGGEQVTPERARPSPREAPALEVEVEVTAPAPAGPAGREQDWGAQFGEAGRGPDEELRLAEDEGPSAPEVEVEISEAAADTEDADAVVTPEQMGASEASAGGVVELDGARGARGPGRSFGSSGAVGAAASSAVSPEPAASPDSAGSFGPSGAVDSAAPYAASESAGAPGSAGSFGASGMLGSAGALESIDSVAEAAAAAQASSAEEEQPVEAQASAEVVAPEQWEARTLGELKPESAMGVPIAELAPALEILGGAVAAPFELRTEGVAITVDGELLTRVEGLLLVTGAVSFEPELKRFRGRTTDQAFGEGAGRMLRGSGRGVMLVAAPEKHRFVTVDLSDESAYFREEVVYAFEEAVTFENGRVPSETTGDLDLVHLRGRGKVLLRLEGALRAHQVRMDVPVTVPLSRLVGWFGNVTPKLVAVALEESGQPVKGGAELSGEGFVLLSVP